MSDLSDDYKAKYELVFQGDVAFSRKFNDEINEFIEGVALPKKPVNNFWTPKDLQGSDLSTTGLEIGVRIRRAKYRRFEDFTEDDKERDTQTPDIEVFGYASPDESKLNSLIVFDHRDFRKARNAGLLRTQRRQNRKHSGVWFTSYPIWDIKNHCTIYGFFGTIGWKKERNKRKGWKGSV